MTDVMLTEAANAFREEAAEHVAREIAPFADQRRSEWTGLRGHTAWNRKLDMHVSDDQLLAAGAPVAAHWLTDRQTGPMLMAFGAEEQRPACPRRRWRRRHAR
jgi:hypothetical protein